MSGQIDEAEVARRLTPAQVAILEALANERRLGLADRAEDRARQGLRKTGLIAYCGKPLRWQISASGLAVRAHLERQP